MGIYVLFSMLALIGLVATLRSRTVQQIEDFHRTAVIELGERIAGELRQSSDSERLYARWQETLRTQGSSIWIVSGELQYVFPSNEQIPPREVIGSAVRAASRTGESVRWYRTETENRTMVIAIAITDDQPRQVLLLLSPLANAHGELPLIADAATQGAIFMWGIGVLCVGFAASRLIRPIHAMTQNLDTGVERTARQDMLLRISDRRDELGNVAQSLTQLEDDREQQMLALGRAEQSSRSGLELLSAVLDSMMEGVIAVDVEERILFLNAGARRLLGIRPLIGVRHRLYEAVRLPVFEETVREALLSRSMQQAEFRVPLNNVFLSIVVSPIVREEYSGAVIVVRDVSEIRRLEAMRRDFVSGVSHELKTPLTVIQACTDTLLSGAMDDPDDARRFLSQIDEQSERLLQLIIGMLQLSRVESGAEVFHFEPVDLAAIVDQTFRMLSTVAESHQVTLERTGLDCFVLSADAQAIRTVFSNLIDNAIKHTPPGGRVTVTFGQVDEKPYVLVRDSGVGIAKEHLSRIFERFYRVDRDRSRASGGTGLGLAIVKHLCQTLGIAIQVSSEVGKGTEFRLVWKDQVLADSESSQLLADEC